MTDYSQLGFLVCCDASPNGTFRGDESRGYADNLFRVNRRIHDIADAMAGRGQQWPDESGSHRDLAARAEVMAKAFGDWYARRHGREPNGEAVRWLAGDWVTGTLPGYENAVSPHRIRALLAYMDDDWLPEEPATVAAYKLLHLAAWQAVDERPDSAWYAEWPAMHRLPVLVVTAASQTRELVEGLEVDAERMGRRSGEAPATLLAERDGLGSSGRNADPASYLGSTRALVDEVLARRAARKASDG